MKCTFGNIIATILAVILVVSPVEVIENYDLSLYVNNFSHSLFSEVLNLDEANPVISGLSAFYALSMIAHGASGTTLEEFEEVLGSTSNTFASQLNELSSNFDLHSSIWLNDDFSVNPYFNKKMKRYFDTTTFSRNFDSEATIEEINAWVYSSTNGNIYGILEQIAQDDAVLIINTLYLQAKWVSSIYPLHESIRQFDGEYANFLTTEPTYLAVNITDNFEAALLPYDCGRLGFFILRPTCGTNIRDFVKSNDLPMIFEGLGYKNDIIVHMPSIENTFEASLINPLYQMGLQTAFTLQADFANLVEYIPPPHISLPISQIHQSIRLSVNSGGTTAAAATAIGQIRAISTPVNPITLDFNSPYFFAIYDLYHSIPLFMGIVEHP